MARIKAAITIGSVAVALCGAAGCAPTPSFATWVSDVPLVLQVDGELQPYAHGRIWMDYSGFSTQGVDVAQLAEDEPYVYMDPDGRVWVAILASPWITSDEVDDDGQTETVFWNYAVDRSLCVSDPEACVRDIQIADEARLQRTADDGLWNDDATGWLMTEITMPGADFYLEERRDGAGFDVSSIMVEIEGAEVEVSITNLLVPPG